MSEESPIYAAPERSTGNPLAEASRAPCGGSQRTSGACSVRLDYPPSCNRVWRTAKGRTYKPAAVIDWMKASATLARAAGIRPTEGPVHVSVTLHPRMNKDGSASLCRIDLDNSLKATLDALQNVAFLNDHQITKLFAEVGEPVKDGGLTVRIETI